MSDTDNPIRRHPGPYHPYHARVQRRIGGGYWWQVIKSTGSAPDEVVRGKGANDIRHSTLDGPAWDWRPTRKWAERKARKQAFLLYCFMTDASVQSSQPWEDT